MTDILRKPELFKKKIYDVIIIGGGIHGIMLALVSSQKRLKTLLLERDDFGGATSFNSLRIIHGGFRYLQNLDLPRFFESVSDRKWFFQNFADLIEPIPCLIPLYGNGVYRPLIFRAALMLNDLLSFKKNRGVAEKSKLPHGKIISAGEVKSIIPQVEISGLKGGAVWYDGAMNDSQRVVIETLKWACSLGADALNYFEGKELLKNNNEVTGVKAYDKESKKYFDFNSRIVINAAGPWSKEVAEGFDKEYVELFKSSIAWNILFNKKAPSNYAVAVTPKRPNAKTYFLRPLKGMLFAGTVHEPWKGIEKNPVPTENSINNFIDDLNSLINNLNLKPEHILHVFTGYMPVKEEGTDILSDREIIIDHSKTNGPRGLFSLSGVKFTTARLIAEKTIKMILKNNVKNITKKRDIKNTSRFNINWNSGQLDESKKEILKEIILTESVLHLDDLILRRTSLGDNPQKALEFASQICYLFDWNSEQSKLEIDKLKNYFYCNNYNSHQKDINYFQN